MGIINRSQDVSEQYEKVALYQKGTVTATNYVVYRCPRPMLISTARAYAAGLSGAPTSTLYVERFVVGTGAATFAVGGALTHAAFGTSGIQSYSLPASGSSLLQCQTGDVIRVLTAGSNAALTDLMVEVVVQNIQDIKTWG